MDKFDTQLAIKQMQEQANLEFDTLMLAKIDIESIQIPSLKQIQMSNDIDIP